MWAWDIDQKGVARYRKLSKQSMPGLHIALRLDYGGLG